jgi:threonine dehydrogenase-like Zn-dependent dehydrogenase
MMRQLSYRGHGDLRVDEVAEPAVPAGHVRVRVHATGICMSDVYGVTGVNDRRDAVLGDGDVLVMGHETAGVVDAVGAGVGEPAVGTPVAVNPIFGCGRCERCARGAEQLCDARAVHGCAPATPGGYADALVVPAGNAVPWPAEAPLELAALVEPLAVGFHGVRLADPRAGEDVLVVGGGIIGLGAALAARRRVGDEVLVLEPRAERRALAQRLGLRALHPDDVLGGGARFGVALDCVARPATFAGAVQAAGPGGRVVLVGISSDEIPLPVSKVVWNETRIVGSYGYTHEDFADVAAWVASGEADLAGAVGHRVGYDGLIGAIRAYGDGSLTAVRTLFRPDLEAA